MPFDAPNTAGREAQMREFYTREIIRVKPELDGSPALYYSDVELEYYRLVNAGIITPAIPTYLEEAQLDANYAPLDEFHSDNYNSLSDLIIAAEASTSNCVIKIAPGKYTTPPLRITKANVTLVTYGADIKLADGSNSTLLSFGPDAVNINVLGDGRWDGNKANNTAGHVIQFEEYTGAFRVADRSNIELAEILNGAQDGLHIARRRVEIKARRCQVRDMGRYGVYFGGTDCSFEAGAIGLCTVAAIWNENIGNWTKFNGIYSCGIGVRLTQGSRGSFTVGNMIDVNDGYGIHVEGITAERSMDAIIEGNLFLSNGQTLDPTLSADIYMQYASSVVLANNIGSKKVGAWNLPNHAIRFGLGVADIIGAGNRWEPAAYTTTVNTPGASPFTDSTLIKFSAHRISVQNPSGPNPIFESKVSSEASPRMEILADGTIRLGPGTGATDVNIYRSAADFLKTDDTFIALGLRMTGTNGSGYLEFSNQTGAPGAVAGKNKQFTRLNASNKTELCMVTSTGVHVMWTEP